MSGVAVVGHTEWVTFAALPALPPAGAIVRASEVFGAAAGGGGVAAVQLQRLTGEAAFFTSLGTDAAGSFARTDLEARGVRLHAAAAGVPQRTAFTQLTDDHERTITVLGDRHVPSGRDPLPWEHLAHADAVYFTGGDASALRAARQARVLVATPRARGPLTTAGVELDAIVASVNDPGERIEPGVPARYVVLTAGAAGGRWTGADGTTGTWRAAALPGPPVDAYGCGDTFAAVLALALGRGHAIGEAVQAAARCGAACLTGRGPYGRALTADLL